MLSRTNLSHLKYFLDAADLSSVTKAADRNGVSQSAVSQAIANLEHVTATKLLRHHRNKFILSSEGHLLVDMLKPIFRQLREMDDIFCTPGDQYQGEVEIVSPRSVALSLLVPRLRVLKEKHPKIIPRLRMFSPDLVRDRLLTCETEIAILIDNVDLTPFETFLLDQGYFRLFRHKGADHLPTDQAIFTEDRREVIQFKRAYEAAFHKPIGVFMQVSSWDVIARLVQGGLACGFLPDYVGKSYPDLTPINLSLPPLTYRIYAAVISQKQLSRNAKVTLDCLCEDLPARQKPTPAA